MAPDSTSPIGWAPDSFAAQGEEAWDEIEESSIDAVDYFVHACYIRQHVPAGATVLNVGMGAHRYAHTLRALGCRVRAGPGSFPGGSPEEAPSAGEGERNTSHGGVADPDLPDLTGIETEAVEVVVAFGGPRCQRLDRVWELLVECERICKPGGIVLASVLSPWGALRWYLEGRLQLSQNDFPPHPSSAPTRASSWHEVTERCDLVRAADLRFLAADCGLRVLTMSATNALSVGWDGFLADVAGDPDRRRDLLRLELEACREEGALNMGTHILLVAGKPPLPTGRRQD